MDEPSTSNTAERRALTSPASDTAHSSETSFRLRQGWLGYIEAWAKLPSHVRADRSAEIKKRACDFGVAWFREQSRRAEIRSSDPARENLKVGICEGVLHIFDTEARFQGLFEADVASIRIELFEALEQVLEDERTRAACGFQDPRGETLDNAKAVSKDARTAFLDQELTKRGWSRYRLAKIAKTDPKTIEHYADGRKTTVANRGKIACALKISVDHLPD